MGRLALGRLCTSLAIAGFNHSIAGRAGRPACAASWRPRQPGSQRQPGQLGHCGGIKLKSRPWCGGEGGEETRRDESAGRAVDGQASESTDQIRCYAHASCLMPHALVLVLQDPPLGTSNSACFDDDLGSS